MRIKNTELYLHTTLGNLVSKEKKSIISGPFGSNIGKIFFRDKGIPVIRGNNLSSGEVKFKDDGFVFITREKANELNCYAIVNDLIFTAVGTIGQVGIISGNLKYNEYVISNKQLRVRFDTTKILPLFAYYWFSSYWIQKLIIQRNVGSTVPLINLSVLKGLPITLPKSLKLQNNIVKLLENLYYKIELNKQINAELEQMAKTIYDYWFVQFDFPISAEYSAAVGQPELEGKPYKSSGGKMVWSDDLKREVPEGWEVRIISEFGRFVNGKGIEKTKFSKDGIYPVYGSNGVTGYSNEILFDEPVIAVGRVGANYGEVHYSLEPCWVSDNAVTAQPVKSFYLWWLIETLKKIDYRKIAGGSAQPLITQGQLKELKFIVPQDDIFIVYNDRVKKNYELLNLNLKENQKLTELRDWLLPMLMNGQVRVVDDVEDGVMGMAAEPLGEYKVRGE
jgi:type I restriction enzyme S subunit